MSMVTKRVLCWAAAFVLLGYAALVLAPFVVQRPLLYMPGTDIKPPMDYGITDARVVAISSADGVTLNAWYRVANPGRPTILFFHGKGGHMGDRHRRWKTYADRGYGILFFDYRGFGASTGEPKEAGLKADSLAAYDWLHAQGILGIDIVLTAESMGTGLAVFVGAQRQAKGISLMSGYSSIADIAAQRYWFAPVNALIKDRFDTLAFAAKLSVPVLQQHGEIDRTIPIQFAERLRDAIVAPKQFILLRGKGHNTFSIDEFKREMDFIEGL